MQILNRYIRLVTPSADYAFGYDDVGRTTSITADLDGFTQSIVMANTFDAASNRTQRAASIGSTADFVDDFSFDNLLRMTRIERQGVGGGNTVAEIRVDLAYNALGQFATIDRFADLAGTKLAVTSAYGYDGANRLASLYHTQSTNDLAKYDFSWDNADRLTSIDSLQDGVTNFTYDATNQLTAADFATQTDETHAWTANGNPTGGGYAVTANNRVSTDGTYNYTYDNEGNRTRKTKISDGSYTDYVWDHRNRLINVINKTSGGTVTQDVQYVYDFLNQLITRTIDADGAGGGSPTSQWFAYSDGQIVLSFDSSSATTPDHRYLWGPQVDQLFADENSTNDPLYPLGDQVGTLRDVAQYDDGTDTTTVVNHVIFSSFNAQLSSSNSTYDILFGQTGRLHDAATRLNNHLHRWLDAWLKRWISEDPIKDGENWSAYVGNHPTYATDPSGLKEPIIDRSQWGPLSGWIAELGVGKGGTEHHPLEMLTGTVAVGVAIFDTAIPHFFKLGTECNEKMIQDASSSDPNVAIPASIGLAGMVHSESAVAAPMLLGGAAKALFAPKGPKIPELPSRKGLTPGQVVEKSVELKRGIVDSTAKIQGAGDKVKYLDEALPVIQKFNETWKFEKYALPDGTVVYRGRGGPTIAVKPNGQLLEGPSGSSVLNKTTGMPEVDWTKMFPKD